MEITHYIAARQTGKSYKAINLYYDNHIPNSYVVVGNNKAMENLIRHHPNPPVENIKTLSNLDWLCGRRINRLIVDEYLIGINEPRKQQIWERLYPALEPDCKIYLLSTPDRKYTEEEIIMHTILCLGISCCGIPVTVINVSENPEEHGFLKFKRKDREHHRRFYGYDDDFETKMLGLWMVGQEFNDFSISKPKKFSMKSIM